MLVNGKNLENITKEIIKLKEENKKLKLDLDIVITALELVYSEIEFDRNRISLLQYESLRKNFKKMVKDVLGEDYYNMAMDVYDADRICCEDITRKANMSIFCKLFNGF